MPKKPEPQGRHELTSILKTPKYKKTENIAYYKKPIFELLNAKTDLYVLSQIFMTEELIYSFFNSLSQSTDSQKEILMTGCYIFGLQNSICTNEATNCKLVKNWYNLNYLDALSLITFRHLAAFGIQIKTGLPEPLLTFSKIIQKLICDYIMRLIVNNIEVVAHRIKEPNLKTITEILEQSIEKLQKNIEHPECLWNESTRLELSNSIKLQLEFYHNNPLSQNSSETKFAEILEKLEYTAYNEEIIVGGVFIKLLNKDPYMNFSKPTATMKDIIQELSTIEKARLSEENSIILNKTIALFEALNNIIVYQKGLDLNAIIQTDIKIICSFLDPFSDVIPKNLEPIYNHLLGILLELTKDHKQTSNIISTFSFIKLLLNISATQKNEFVLKRIMVCLENIIGQQDCDAILVKSGLLIMFLKNAIDRNTDKKYRLPFFGFALTILGRNGLDADYFKKIQNVVPKQLLEILLQEKNLKNDEIKIEDLLNYLDNEHREICLIWNTELYIKTIEALKNEAEKILENIKKIDSETEPKWEPPVESYIAPYINKGEIVIQEIVLSVYNKNPFVKIMVFFYFVGILKKRNRMGNFWIA